MGLKGYFIKVLVVAVGALAFTPNAFAWYFDASGTAECVPSTGEYVITWTLDNRSEPDPLVIRKSNRDAIKVLDEVPAFHTRSFTERLIGTTVGTITLLVEGNWARDTHIRGPRNGNPSVTLDGKCVPPDVCPNIEGIQTKMPEGFEKDANGNCHCPPKTIIVEREVPGPERIVEKTVEVPGPERIVNVPGPERIVEVAGPERIVEKRVEVPGATVQVPQIVTKVVTKTKTKRVVKVKRVVKIKRVLIKAKAKRQAPRPRALPFTK